jgi:hypothetical protein
MHRQHLTDPIVLTLVVFAALQTSFSAAGTGHRYAYFKKSAQRWPLPQFGPHDVDIRIAGDVGQQRSQGTRIRGGIVMQDPDPIGILGCLDAHGHRRGKGGRAGGRNHGLGSPGRAEQLSAVVLAAGVDGNHPVGGYSLGSQPVDDLGQPPRTIMAHHKRDNDGGGVHGGQP